MSLLLALFLVVHGCIHVGYICGPAWPFAVADPWLITGLGVGADTVRTAGVSIVAVTVVAWLAAAFAAAGLALPVGLWKPTVALACVASAIALVAFVTPWTVPGLAIDTVLLWATVARGWQPVPFFGH